MRPHYQATCRLTAKMAFLGRAIDFLGKSPFLGKALGWGRIAVIHTP